MTDHTQNRNLFQIADTIESSSLVPVLFREVFSHPDISFFHLLVNGFFVTLYMCVQKKIVIERTRDLIYIPQIGSDRLLPENN